MSIPKPNPFKFRILHNLHDAMVNTHASDASFKEFKHWVQFYGSKLNPMNFKEYYSVEAWAKFLDKILLIQPELTLYEEYWPVEAYFNFYMSNRRRLYSAHRPLRRLNPREYKLRSKNTAMAPEISSPGASSLEPSFNMNMCDNQQSVSCTTYHSTPSPCGSPVNELSVNPFGSRLGNVASRSDGSLTLSTHLQSPERHSTNATASSSFSTAPILYGGPISGKNLASVGLEVSSRISAQEHPNMQKLVVSCFKCGNVVTVKSTLNKRLVDLAGKIDLVSNLAKLGIFLDQHLDELLHLEHDDLVIFFSNVASNHMTPLAKLQFIKSIRVESLNTQKRRMHHSVYIPCPPWDTERCPTDPSRPDEGYFQKMTKLEDDDFQELMNVMGIMSRDYFSIYRPNIDQLCKVVTTICFDSRLLNQYENFWPLKIYLKRRSTSIGTRPLYDEAEAEAVFAKVFRNHRHFELPTLVQLPCKLHPPIDISQVPHTLQIRLHALRIAELIPALASVGIHSDAQFTDFCKLNNQERDDLFILGKLKLSQFQRFRLRLALSLEI